MTSATLTQVEEKIQLSGISWKTYESLLNELSENRRLRLTYYYGNLEIMVPSPEHERYKRVVGRFVETLAEELNISIDPLGSTTFKRLESVGAEPDECFYIQNLNLVRGKKRIDLIQDPPPDLVIEVDVTSSSINRLEVYAALGVLEVWRYDGNSLTIYQLQEQRYIVCEDSLAFPNVPIQEISGFLQQVGSVEYLELVKAFRNWIRSRI